jgi:hypothetical protein
MTDSCSSGSEHIEGALRALHNDRSAPVLTPDMKPQVGRFYMVRCVKLHNLGRHPATDRHGWIPVIGPEHHDRGTIGFKAMHLHVDPRFLTAEALRSVYTPFRPEVPEQQAMIQPASTHSDDDSTAPGARHEIALRKKLCAREMPDFPRDGAFNRSGWMHKLEREYAGCKLKPGNICPHRGIDLTPFIKDDGTAICPGHGLRWDTRTGELLAEAQSGGCATRLRTPLQGAAE